MSLVLSHVLQLAGPAAELVTHCEKAWGSANFSGQRHTIALQFSGGPNTVHGETFIAAFPDHFFDVADTIVADAVIIHVDRHLAPAPRTLVTVCLLTIDEA
ncbi:hypothetical protein WBP07_12620 [Novosphingobium sp. BL-8A]|uniref:hypothetical protein n=1 Tax=Novosphingobium sp. BL-8A TaxID=3127639 RepID=UPI0037584CE9